MGRDIAVQYRAPGRVNIIGEHTDYNDGFVLPITTAAHTTIDASPRDDRIVRLVSRNLNDTREFTLGDIAVSSSPTWCDYARGVAAGIEAVGVTLRGADFTIDGTVPIGGGLSSSASFEVAVAIALLDVAGAELAPTEIASLCRTAEVQYAGVECGIMDQMAIAACRRDLAMFLDCRSLEFRDSPIPEDARFLVVDSGVRHQLSQSGFNDRTRECREAASLLARYDDSVTALRDVTPDLLEAASADMDDTLVRRARHVVTEIQRVVDAFEALETGDLSQLGELAKASHVSLCDDFDNTCKPTDDLVGIADRCDGVYGSRQVGGGFGGCVLVVTSADAVDDVRAKITTDYSAILGSDPWTHIVSGADPAGPVQE